LPWISAGRVKEIGVIFDMDTQHVNCGFNLDPTFGLRR